MPREMNLEAIRKRFDTADWDHNDVEWFYARVQRGYWMEIKLAELWDRVLTCPKCGTRIKLQEEKQCESKFGAITPSEKPYA